MHPLCNVLFILAIACSFVLPVSSLRAGTPMSDRVAVEAGVRTELAKDLAAASGLVRSFRQTLS